MTDSHKPLLKVMTDYHCWPLWISDGPDYFNVEPRELGLPEDLCQALIQWSDQFDAILNEDDPASSDFSTPEAEQEFVALGRALARTVKSFLQDRFEVMYYDMEQTRLVPVDGS